MAKKPLTTKKRLTEKKNEKVTAARKKARKVGSNAMGVPRKGARRGPRAGHSSQR